MVNVCVLRLPLKEVEAEAEATAMANQKHTMNNNNKQYTILYNNNMKEIRAQI